MSKVKVFSYINKHICRGTLSGPSVAQIVDTLSSQVRVFAFSFCRRFGARISNANHKHSTQGNNFTGDELVNLIEHIVESNVHTAPVVEGSMLALLPKLLAQLAQKTKVTPSNSSKLS